MWDKWKKRISGFIWKEVEETVEVEPKQTTNTVFEHTHREKEHHENLQARIAYRYPKHTLPPKQSLEKRPQINNLKQDEKPAYQRRNRRENVQKQDMEYNSNRPRGNHFQKKMDSSRKVYKRDPDKPFKPSDVPSPIYGFHNRKEESEIKEVPAYMRRQETMPTDKKAGISNQMDDIQQQERNTEHIETAATEDTAPHIESPVVENKEQTGMDYQEVHSLLRSQYKQEKEPIKEQTQSEKLEPIIPLNKNKKDRVHKETSKQNQKNVPYNVMMNAEDLKNKQQRQAVNRPIHYVPDVRRQAKDVQFKSSQPQPVQEAFVNQTATSSNEAGEDSFKQSLQLPLHLLDDTSDEGSEDDSWVTSQQELLEQTLKYFNVRAKVVHATQGPAVTRFEVQPELGVKVSKVKNLSDDLKLNMSAKDIRIEAPIPGKNTIGIEVPNKQAKMVGLQEVIGTESFQEAKSPLTVALGLNIEGTPMMTNIQQMPHGLIAGATGSGKSVCINTILVSLLYKASHEDVKFMLIDPKMVELAAYNGIPHLISPVITDVKAATVALKWAVGEMEDRYDRFVHEGVRDIKRYNARMKNQNRLEEKMPYIVIVIDELADLMMVSPQDVEDAICRIAQKARACGIHLLLATQRPSVDVLTGLIKANIPTRIAFSVSSQVDSRTILDSSGAEKLLGRGDMLFIENGTGKTLRLQGPFVSDDEIERVTNHARTLGPANYLFEQESLLEKFSIEEEEDELLRDAISFVISRGGASTSLLQRHFKIGYNRAARLIDSLEYKGIISGQNGSKQREILVSENQVEEMMQY